MGEHNATHFQKGFVMRKLWLMFALLWVVFSPALFGCSSQVSQETANEQVEREAQEMEEEGQETGEEDDSAEDLD